MNTPASLPHFAGICQQKTNPGNYPLAQEIVKNVLIYHASRLAAQLAEKDHLAGIRQEWATCLLEGPGVFVVKGAFEDLSIIDEMSTVFKTIIQRETRAGKNKGDHFGQNERIWNSIQKTCLAAPHLFADYYGNPFIALASEAWLGPGYQLTAQVNIVKPGGAAQSAHRDYHLGFQSRDTSAKFPRHAQVMSQFLTLQGAVVHSEMPIESGPTRILPFSQQFEAGYLTFREDPFADYFNHHAVQLHLEKGDLLFFNPALFHAAGSNQSSTDRIANLIQISSAFGRPMETVDRLAMIEAVYPELLRRMESGTLSPQQQANTLAALTHDYAFPTNLDSDPPLDGNAPQTQKTYVQEALLKNTAWEQLHKDLTRLADRQKA